jgi:hypothetical protein
MSSAAAHWSPAVTELVQLVRTRWRENCFVGTKKRFQFFVQSETVAIALKVRSNLPVCPTASLAPRVVCRSAGVEIV